MVKANPLDQGVIYILGPVDHPLGSGPRVGPSCRQRRFVSAVSSAGQRDCYQPAHGAGRQSEGRCSAALTAGAGQSITPARRMGGGRVARRAARKPVASPSIGRPIARPSTIVTRGSAVARILDAGAADARKRRFALLARREVARLATAAVAPQRTPWIVIGGLRAARSREGRDRKAREGDQHDCAHGTFPGSSTRMNTTSALHIQHATRVLAPVRCGRWRDFGASGHRRAGRRSRLACRAFHSNSPRNLPGGLSGGQKRPGRNRTAYGRHPGCRHCGRERVGRGGSPNRARRSTPCERRPVSWHA